MLEENQFPLSHNSSYTYTLKRVPNENRYHIADPTVISKVESSGNYLLNYENSIDIKNMNLVQLRNEMGSPNLDLCSSPIEEYPYLVRLHDRMIPITIFRHAVQEKQKALIFIHGGGFIGGSTNVLKNQCRLLAEQSGAAVISIDYRLAPENPYPAGLNDCKDIIFWLADHAEELNILSNKIAISGESAGGNYAMACSLSEAGKHIALTIPIYGAFDLSHPSVNNYWNYDAYPVIPEHKKYVLTRLNRFANLNTCIQQMYCSKKKIHNPEVSPLYAKDFSYLKNVVMIEAEFDFFRLSNDLMAQKLLDANIPCRIIRYQGMDHGFFDRLGYCAQTKDCILEIANLMKEL